MIDRRLLAVIAAVLCVLPLGAVLLDDSSAATVDKELEYDVSLQPGQSFKSVTVGYKTDRAAWDYVYVDIIDADGCDSLYISKERADSADVYYLRGVIDEPGSYDVVVQTLTDASPSPIRYTYTFHFTVSSSGTGDSESIKRVNLILDASDAGVFTLQGEMEAWGSGPYYRCVFDLSQVYPILPGSDFVGWSESLGGDVVATDSYTVTVLQSEYTSPYDVTLYAVFDTIVVPPGKVLLTVYFDSSGGSAVSPMNYYADEGGSHSFDLSGRETTREGFKFEGWSLSPDSDSTVGSVTIVDGGSDVTSVTVYAVWSEDDGSAIGDFFGDILTMISDPFVLVLLFLIVFCVAYLIRVRKIGEW